MTQSSIPIVSSPLAVVADVAARLATPEPLEARLTATLAILRDALGATSCAIWQADGAGMLRRAIVGENDEAAPLTLEPREGEANTGPFVRRLVAHQRNVGTLVIDAPAMSVDAQLLASTIARLLAPELARDEEITRLRIEIDDQSRRLENERRFTEKIIDSLPVGLYVIDREYRVQAWNRKRETGMQGVSREEALGRTIFEVLHRQPAELLRREFDEVLRTGRLQQYTLESRATGEVRTYRITKIPMRLGDAGITHVITIGEDITDWREAHDRFAQTEKLAAIGQLAAGVMHEINNPLATIAACGESLALRLDDVRAAGTELAPQCDEYLTIIDNEVQRCKRIIEGLLEFSRSAPRTKMAVSLNAVIEQTLFLLKHHARFKRVPIELLLDPELALVNANTEQLVQVFMALLLNAADAGEDDSPLIIRTRPGIAPNERVVAEIIDRGHGIPRSELGKIFEPFYTTKPPGRGTGLGLSICYGIVSDHGGRIEVDSALGAGSTFRMLFPEAEEPE
ncbi:MAG TPA: ATP-binding protein [Gemmatimonadaceae bacterium]|nr:ATP-binding protein [Gemmatimonadaceae bacterium]